MYGRAPRVLAPTSGGSTTSKIGPGAYSPQEPRHRAGMSSWLPEKLEFVYNLRVDGFAPFSSLATRETFLDISDNVAMAPGPGYYDPKLSKPRKAINGTGAMNSKVIVYSHA